MKVEEILQLSDLGVFEVFAERAALLGKEVVTDNLNYMAVIGTDPSIWLVAHIDTVFRGVDTRRIVNRRGILHAVDRNNQRAILGADDRAGCYALYKLMDADHRPNILLTNFEEVGGRGAHAFSDTTLWTDAKLFIEFDRAGVNEYVQYNLNPQDLHNWLSKFNITYSRGGSFSDIRIISDRSGIPSFNMAIGYSGQHSSREILDVSAMNMAIEKAGYMIKDFLAKGLDFGKIQKPAPRERTDFSQFTRQESKFKIPVIQIQGHENFEGWTTDEESGEVGCATCGKSFTDGHSRICKHFRGEDEETGFLWEQAASC